MNNIIKKLRIVGPLLLLLLVFSTGVNAKEAAGSIQIVELTAVDKVPVQGVELAIYQIGLPDATAPGTYTLAADFVDCKVDLGALSDKEKYASTIEKLDAYIEKENLQGLENKVTSQSGTADFQGLSDGLYFVKQTNLESDFEKLGYSFSTESFLAELPSKDENGNQTRTVLCYPKITVQSLAGETVAVVVNKVWKDDNDSNKIRPDEIAVGLYDDGELKEKVSLTVKENWTYQWTGLDKEVTWSVKELKVPSGYKSSVSNEEMIFTITNVLDAKKESTIAKTGDDSVSGNLIAVGLISFGVMVIILIWKKEKWHLAK